MSVLPILIAPHPILSTAAKPVDTINDEIRQIVKDMIETMYADNGIGLAANQVGILKRIFVMDVRDDNSLTRDSAPIEPKVYCFINPVIESFSEKKVDFEEGCLSVPGQGIQVERSVSLTMRYSDEQGVEKLEHFEGLQARCILHEMDHINGIVMLDYLSKLKKDLVIKKLQKHYPNS